MLENLFTLGMLLMLQLVLGFDNLLYISLESKTVTPDKQAFVRKVGISLAIVLRIILLFIIVNIIPKLQNTFLEFHGNYFEAEVNMHSIIVLFGGGFIIYTAIKEIWHMISLEEDHVHEEKGRSSVAKAIIMIVIMNLVFSFDSILSAIALTNVFWVMATAIVISGILMIVLADKVSDFLAKNRMYEVLGLFILFLVGIMLLTEGAHLAHIHFFGNPVEVMSKTTFYFILIILVIVDIVQGRYQRKLIAEKNRIRVEKNKIQAENV